MATNVGYTNGLMNEQAPSIAWSVVRLLWHFVQMFVAMMVGMMIFHILVGKSTEANRIIWYAGMELSMVPPMVALMLFQRHGWRHSAEMAAAMLIGPAVFLTCAQLGLHNYIPGITRNTFLTLSDATMLLGMVGAMLYRREMYTRPHARHQHAAAADAHVHHGST